MLGSLGAGALISWAALEMGKPMGEWFVKNTPQIKISKLNGQLLGGVLASAFMTSLVRNNPAFAAGAIGTAVIWTALTTKNIDLSKIAKVKEPIFWGALAGFAGAAFIGPGTGVLLGAAAARNSL